MSAQALIAEMLAQREFDDHAGRSDENSKPIDDAGKKAAHAVGCELAACAHTSRHGDGANALVCNPRSGKPSKCKVH